MTAASGKADGGAELLPCPFCGGQPEIKDGHPLALVVCPDCRSRSMAINQYEAKRNWNRRTPAANGPGEALSNAPERIYLQDGIDKDDAEDGIVPADVYNGNEDMTWCKDRINDNDTEYVRADLSIPQPGTVTVPREPTKDMLEEGFDAINKQYARDPLDDALERTQAVYRAMLDAAPRSGGRESGNG